MSESGGSCCFLNGRSGRCHGIEDWRIAPLSYVLLNYIRNGKKGSLKVSNVRRKTACVVVPLFLTSFFLFPYWFLSQPFKTPCFTPLKQALDPLSSSAVILETSFGLLVESVNEQGINTQIWLWSLHQPWLQPLWKLVFLDQENFTWVSVLFLPPEA